MANSQYLDQVQQLYIAYFGRPADPAGLQYWAQQVDQAGGNIAGVMSGFSASAESQALYGAVTYEDQVKAIYQNIFGRAPEPAGLAYWTGILANGGSASQMAFRVLQAAQGSDAAIVNNKVTAANAFTANIDTAAEISGYTGEDALAAARAFLSKVDASPASIANLASDAAAAVGNATGTAAGGGAGGGGGGGGTPPATFTATKDAVSNDVTFANGTNITAALANGTYTFASGGTSVPITGTVSSITVSSGAKLTIDLATAGSITFPGAGTVVLSDTAASASLLKAIETATTGLLDASAVTSISGSTSISDAQLLLITKNGSSGDKIKTAANVTLTLGEPTADAAALKAIETHTTGLVDATGVVTITAASVADAKQLLITDKGVSGDKINLASNVAVTLTDTSAGAADLAAIEAATEGLVDAQSITAITDASLADAAFLISKKTTTGDGINLSGGVAITLTDTTGNAAALVNVEAATTGFVDASSLTAITGATAAQAQTLLSDKRGSSGDAIHFASDVAVTIDAGTTTTTGAVLAAILDGTTGAIDASFITTINGISMATAELALVTRPGTVTLADNVALKLSGTTFNAADLSTVEAATSGLVSFQEAGGGVTVTGTLAQVKALYAHNAASGDAIDMPALAMIILSDTGEAAAADLLAIETATSDLVTATGFTSMTGSLADIQQLVGKMGTSGDHINLAANLSLSLTDTSLSASDLNTLDSLTTSTVDFSGANNTVTGTLAEVNTLLSHKVSAGDNGVNLADSVNIVLRDGTLAAAALNILATQTTGLIDTTGNATSIGGTAADLMALYAHQASGASGVKIGANIPLTVNGTAAAAADLITLDAKTGGTVDFSASGNTITGTLADLQTLLSHTVALGNNGVALAGNLNITLSDASLTAAELNSLQGQTTGLVDVSSATTITGSAADMATLFSHQSSTAPGIKTAANVTLTLDAGSANATDLNTLNAKTSGTVDFSGADNTIVGTLANVNTVLGAQVATGGNGIKTAGSVRISLSDTSLAAADLNTLDSKTTGTVNFSTNGNTVTGTLAEVNTLLSHRADAGNDGVNLGGSVLNGVNPTLNIVLSDSDFVPSDLAILNGKTSGLISLSASDATITGLHIDIVSLYGGNRTSGNGINLGAANLVITDTAAQTTSGAMTAAGLRTRDDLTTGLISFANTGLTVPGYMDDFNALYANNTTTGNGINLPGDLKLVISLFATTSMAASDIVTLDGRTTGLVDATAVAAMTGATVAQAKQLLVDGVTNSQVSHKSDVTVTIIDTGSATAADLKAIAASTTGLVTATGISGITAASVADAKQLLVSDHGTSGDKINLSGAIAVTLSDTSLSDTSALVAVDNATTGLVDASSVTSINGTSLADLTQLLVTNAGSAGNAVKWSGSQAVTLSGITTATADQLVKINNATTGLVTATDVATITSASAADAFQLLSTDLGSQIALKSDVAITLVAGSASATQLLGVETHTTGFVDAFAITSLDGSAADLKQLLVTDNGSSGDKIGISTSVATTVTGTSALASDLIAIDAVVQTAVNANAVTGITGTAAEIQAALAAIQADTITASSLNTVTLTNGIDGSTSDSLVFSGDMTVKLANAGTNIFTVGNSSMPDGKTLTVDASAVTASGVYIVGAQYGVGNLVAKGGSGSDVLAGGAGADTLTGGGGADLFSMSLSTVSSMDTITDYRASGNDTIINFGGVRTSSITITDRSAASTLTAALNAAAAANTTSGGVTVFIWDHDTYIYKEISGSEVTAASNDGLIRIIGTPFAVGTDITTIGLGI